MATNVGTVFFFVFPPSKKPVCGRKRQNSCLCFFFQFGSKRPNDSCGKDIKNTHAHTHTQCRFLPLLQRIRNLSPSEQKLCLQCVVGKIMPWGREKLCLKSASNHCVDSEGRKLHTLLPTGETMIWLAESANSLQRKLNCVALKAIPGVGRVCLCFFCIFQQKNLFSV